MKHRFLIVLIICFFINAQIVSANIMCNDGSKSPSCSDCHQGCCSHHGGCASSYYKNYNSSVDNENNQSYNEEYDDDKENDYIGGKIVTIMILAFWVILIGATFWQRQ